MMDSYRLALRHSGEHGRADRQREPLAGRFDGGYFLRAARVYLIAVSHPRRIRSTPITPRLHLSGTRRLTSGAPGPPSPDLLKVPVLPLDHNLRHLRYLRCSRPSYTFLYHHHHLRNVPKVSMITVLRLDRHLVPGGRKQARTKVAPRCDGGLKEGFTCWLVRRSHNPQCSPAW
jgi:hypothetical protein